MIKLQVLPPNTGNNRGFPADEEDQSQEAVNSWRIPYRAAGEAEVKYEDHILDVEFGIANLKGKIGRKKSRKGRLMKKSPQGT